MLGSISFSYLRVGFLKLFDQKEASTLVSFLTDRLDKVVLGGELVGDSRKLVVMMIDYAI